ncbi:MAG: hypothetical protein K5776_10235 [Lachnospiraceae bacterium]|nr:hypothetical protein [Lachnospiraceae bacterium]
MRKKLLAATTLLCVALCGLTGCKTGKNPYTDLVEITRDTETKTSQITPMHMSVDKNTGLMEITRPYSPGIPMGGEDTWTIFVYICGSNLETNDSSASDDIWEMVVGYPCKNVKFVVETGGAEEWQNDFADADHIGRFLIENNEVKTIENLENASMGDPATLADFLKWGVKEYPAEHMGVIFWDHGGGSISGVCFDDLYYKDSLSLREIDSAFYSVFSEMTDKFEFVGFDACLMSTVEAANILASYSRYMIASQEIESGYGWDYTIIGDYLNEHPHADGEEFGRALCDAFYESCENNEVEDSATLSLVDLGKIDDVVKGFNSFAMNMYKVTEDTLVLSDIVREIHYAENFGGNNRNDGYTNMVDLSGMIQACSQYTDGSEALQAIESAVIYNKSGIEHLGCSGMSVYFPLSVEGSTELSVFEDITISPFYASFVDRQDFSSSIFYDDYYDDEYEYEEEDYPYDMYYDEKTGYYYFRIDGIYYCYNTATGTSWYFDAEQEDWIVTDESLEFDFSTFVYEDSYDDFGYSDEYWFDEEESWESDSEYEWDEEYKCFRPAKKQNDHWDYADNFVQTGESRFITFLKEPSFNKDGRFGFTLDARGIDHAIDVYGVVFKKLEDGSGAYLLGDTYDIYGDWETGHFEEGFSGYWLSLPDGQGLDMTIISFDDDYVVYSSSILLNGERTNLRMRQSLEDASVIVDGAWDGIEENGSSSRKIKKINPGDVIVPSYITLTYVEDEDNIEWTGEEYTVGTDFKVTYSPLGAGDYLYAFTIDDIYNDYYLSEFAEFNISDTGALGYYR